MSKRECFYLAIGTAVIVAIPLVIALERSCFLPSPSRPTRIEYQQRLSRIGLDDGIDSSEAAEIAKMYMSEFMSQYVGMCGGLDPPALHDGTWTNQLRLGVAGRRSETIEVDVKTGGVSSSAGPYFGTLRGFADAIAGGNAAGRR
jgi:hypothetical protein